MTTEERGLMIPEAGELPAYAINKDAAVEAWGDLLSGMPMGAPPRVKLNGTQFCLVDASGNEETIPAGELFINPVDKKAYLRMMVLKARPGVQKQWYAKPYDPNAEGVAPDCFSNDGERPDASAPSKQCDTCAACCNNAWGSAVNQSGVATDGKACRDTKTLAVYIPNKGIYSFRIPPGSFKNWSLLGRQLVNAGIQPGMVIYHVGFDDKATFPILTFNYGGIVPEKAIPALMAKAESSEVTEIINNRITAGVKADANVAGKAEQEKVEQVSGDDLGLGDELDAGAAQQAAKEASAKKSGGKKGAAKQQGATGAAANTAADAGPSDKELRDELGLDL